MITQLSASYERPWTPVLACGCITPTIRTYSDSQVDDHCQKCPTFLLILISRNHTPIEQHILVFTKFLSDLGIDGSKFRTPSMLCRSHVSSHPCSYPVLRLIFNVLSARSSRQRNKTARTGCADIFPTALGTYPTS